MKGKEKTDNDRKQRQFSEAQLNANAVILLIKGTFPFNLNPLFGLWIVLILYIYDFNPVTSSA